MSGLLPEQGAWSFGPSGPSPDVHHVVVSVGRVECVPGCPARPPHIAEYRASDVNPDR